MVIRNTPTHTLEKQVSFLPENNSYSVYEYASDKCDESGLANSKHKRLTRI